MPMTTNSRPLGISEQYVYRDLKEVGISLGGMYSGRLPAHSPARG